MSGSFVLSTYLAVSRMAPAAYRLALRRRIKAGKEDPLRLPERYGRSDMARPAGRLLWMHAASIGETQSLLGLIPALLEADADLSILVTSTTVTSARLLAQDLPERAFHQFSPIDTPQSVRRFLDHWQPDAAVWVESEIWPNMLRATKARAVPMVLINARFSPKTLERYGWLRRTAVALFSQFDEILAQDAATYEGLQALGLPAVSLTGSLKEELAPPLKDAAVLADLQADLAGRSVWAAASTHPEEEEVLLQAHRVLDDDSLLLLIPRHPERGAGLAAQMRSAGWRVAQRSAGEALQTDTQIYLADTIGEMGLWYRLARISFVAGSLQPIGGHNPFEPILLGSAVIAGSQTRNFEEVYAKLTALGGCRIADTPAEIAAAVTQLRAADRRDQQVARAQSYLKAQSSITPLVGDRILAHLDRVA